MTEEELYAGAGEVTRKCLDDILESEYGFVQDDEETYTSEYLSAGTPMKKLTHRSTC